MAAGEAPIQKVTISHVGERWQESVLERYLNRYQIRPVFQSVVQPVVSLQHQASPAPGPSDCSMQKKTQVRSLS